MKKLPIILGLLILTTCGQKEPSKNPNSTEDSLVVKEQIPATKAHVTGSNVIIRSDHTTASASAGVVAKEGTVVQILERYNSGSSNEAILKRGITIINNGNQMRLPEGKALNILADHSDSVRASFSTPDYGKTEATINKNDIEAMGGERWYKIRTNDDITGWIYGKFIEEM